MMEILHFLLERLERFPIELKSWFLNLLGSFGVPQWILAVLSAVIIIGTVIGVFLGLLP